MPEIIRFNTGNIGKGGDARVSGQGRSALSSAEQIADAVHKVSQSVQAEGEKFMQDARLAMSGAQYNRAMTKGALELERRKQERLQNQLDEDGNPNYETLVSDMELIGREVMAEAGKQIRFSDARQAFEQKFQENIANNLVDMGKKQREMQINWGLATLNESINATREMAIAGNPADVGLHEQTIDEMVGTALAGQLITPVQAEELLRQTTQDIRTGQWRRQIDNNPVQALENLNKQDSGALLGLNNQNYLALKREAEGRVAAISQANKAQAAHQETQAKFTAINEIITTEGSLAQYTDKELNEHFSQSLAAFENKYQRPPTFAEKYQLVQGYKRPNKQFLNEVAHHLVSGDSQAVSEVLPVLNAATNDRQQAILFEGLDKNASAVLANAKVLYGTGVVSPQDAILRARENVFVDTAVEQERALEFKAIEDFKMDNINETVMDMYDTSIFDDPDALQAGVGVTMQTLLRAAYLETGSKEGAIELVKQKYGRLYGQSQMSGNDTIMLLPPENLYPNIDPEWLKVDLIRTMAEHLPQGVSSDELLIQSGAFTTANPNKPAYTVFYVGEDGLQKQLRDAEGEQLLWTPDKKYLDSVQFRQDKIDAVVATAEAEALRENAIDVLPAGVSGIAGLVGRQASKLYNFAVKTVAGRTGEAGDARRSQKRLLALEKAEAELAMARASGDTQEIGRAAVRVAASQKAIGQDPNITDRSELGSITKLRESSDNPAAWNPRDPHGGSYGKWQLNGANLDKFLSESDYGIEFKGLMKGSTEFLAKWKQIAHQPDFIEAQRQYIIKENFEPTRRVANRLGVPESPAIDEALFSLGVQHGTKSRRKVLEAAKKNLLNTVKDGTEAQWVEAIYKARMNAFPEHKKAYIAEWNKVRQLLGR